ncbi:elongase of fatty acids ELO [Auriculariales sp. MPI-PUGE-AT-0066]|nr:elongase of fatty acids ELO [Auriculariales sp. MPI-PUGE-AT-0066]
MVNSDALVSCTVAGYLMLVKILCEFMRHRKPVHVLHLYRLHNAALALGSMALLSAILSEVIPYIFTHGLFSAICNETAWTQRLERYYTINYYTKYWELLDTAFIVMMKKPFARMHLFHHSTVLVLCYTQLKAETPMSWVIIVNNLFVQVPMYYYYFATADGRYLWWKQYLTQLQIVQIFVDMLVIFFGSYNHIVFTYAHDWLPVVGDCAISDAAALFSSVLMTTFFILFLNFYCWLYVKRR